MKGDVRSYWKQQGIYVLEGTTQKFPTLYVSDPGNEQSYSVTFTHLTSRSQHKTAADYFTKPQHVEAVLGGVNLELFDSEIEDKSPKDIPWIHQFSMEQLVARKVSKARNLELTTRLTPINRYQFLTHSLCGDVYRVADADNFVEALRDWEAVAYHDKFFSKLHKQHNSMLKLFEKLKR